MPQFTFLSLSSSFFFNATATTEIYTLSLHDASSDLACRIVHVDPSSGQCLTWGPSDTLHDRSRLPRRSEEHTSELQSHSDLVCRLLLEKKKKNKQKQHTEQK